MPPGKRGEGTEKRGVRIKRELEGLKEKGTKVEEKAELGRETKKKWKWRQ